MHMTIYWQFSDLVHMRCGIAFVLCSLSPARPLYFMFHHHIVISATAASIFWIENDTKCCSEHAISTHNLIWNNEMEARRQRDGGREPGHTYTKKKKFPNYLSRLARLAASYYTRWTLIIFYTYFRISFTQALCPPFVDAIINNRSLKCHYRHPYNFFFFEDRIDFAVVNRPDCQHRLVPMIGNSSETEGHQLDFFFVLHRQNSSEIWLFFGCIKCEKLRIETDVDMNGSDGLEPGIKSDADRCFVFGNVQFCAWWTGEEIN